MAVARPYYNVAEALVRPVREGSRGGRAANKPSG